MVEAHEALSRDEFRIRLGVGDEAFQHVVDEMRALMGMASLEEVRQRFSPTYGRDGSGPEFDDERDRPDHR